MRVSAPPVDGGANEAVVRLVAARLKVPASAVTNVRGERSAHKQLRIDGLPEMEMELRVLSMTEPDSAG